MTLTACLGFPADMDAAFARRLFAAAVEGEQIPVNNGTGYVRWSPGAGVEVWLVIRDEQFVGASYHFEGRARATRIELTARVNFEPDNPLVGGFHGWVRLGDDEEEASSGYPLIFAVPDFARHDALELPAFADVQLAAFACELSAFATVEEYDASPAGELGLATNAFIPLGLFHGPVEEWDRTPQPLACLSGHVIETRVLSNPFSGGSFAWARVQTGDGEVDVVADPTAVKGTLAAGAIVHGDFRLSGRLVEPILSKG